jgi:AhpC/TSA antioxidant enzyme
MLKFLELNPSIPANQMFVDDENFSAYDALGLGSMRNVAEKSEEIRGIQLAAPDLGGIQGWWKYLSNVAAVSPTDKGKFGIPEGVLRLGGTFVVQGDEVVYAWRERVPGDTPDLAEVMAFLEL